MPKPAHTRVTFEGVFGTVAAPIEHWSFNVNFPADALPADGTDLVADAVATDAAGAFNTTIRGYFPSDVICTRVKVAHVNADGHVATRPDGSYVQGIWEGSLAGAGARQPMPLQTALCISLLTGRPGPTGKGRYFVPWPAIGLDDLTKQISALDAETRAGREVDFLNALAAVMTFPPQVVSSKGYMSEIIGVRIGRVPDTMRSRREDLPEGYVTAFLA